MSDYFVNINNSEYQVSIPQEQKVVLGEVEFHCELIELNKFHFSLKLNEKMYDVIKVNSDKNKVGILLNGNYFEVEVQTKLEKVASNIINKSQRATHHSEVRSPMPGMVLKIKKNPGDSVEIGDSVLILEAMKMENDIKSPFSGVIKEIFVSENNPVEKNTVLFCIE